MGYHALCSLEIWNGACYYKVFDEWTDIHMYTYMVVLNQNAPVVEKNPGWRREGGGGEVVGGDKKFSVLFKGEQKIFNEEQIFFDIHFQFQEPLSGGKK